MINDVSEYSSCPLWGLQRCLHWTMMIFLSPNWLIAFVQCLLINLIIVVVSDTQNTVLIAVLISICICSFTPTDLSSVFERRKVCFLLLEVRKQSCRSKASRHLIIKNFHFLRKVHIITHNFPVNNFRNNLFAFIIPN